MFFATTVRNAPWLESDQMPNGWWQRSLRGGTSAIRVVAEGVRVEWTQYVSRPEDAQAARVVQCFEAVVAALGAGRWCSEDHDRATSQGREAGGSITPAHPVGLPTLSRSGRESGSPGSNKLFKPWEICSEQRPTCCRKL